MIKRIYIDNFRCFSNFEFKPDRINLLLGLNGSGKSSFMEVFDRVLGLILEGQQVENIFSEEDLTRWDSRDQQRFECDLEIAEKTFIYTLVLEKISARMVVHSERVTRGEATLFEYKAGEVFLHRNDGTLGTHFALRGTASFLHQIENRPENTDLMAFLDALRKVRSYKLDPTRIDALSSGEEERLAKNGSNFASWYRHISQEEAGAIPQFFEDLKEIISGFEALALRGAGKQGRVRDLLVQMHAARGDAYEVDFDAISDGQRALILLYALLIDIAATPRFVFLDEPENYIGLTELQPWLQRLDDALGDEGQLFFISHHPEVIDHLASETPILFERSDGGPVRVRQAEFDRESGLRASEQISMGILDVE
ncbi:MAG: AAA family ATPase [Deltaproteobacteria bacterium]|nr:AAA family ATPase [Deltaproteobacteria bacterium]